MNKNELLDIIGEGINFSDDVTFDRCHERRANYAGLENRLEKALEEVKTIQEKPDYIGISKDEAIDIITDAIEYTKEIRDYNHSDYAGIGDRLYDCINFIEEN